MIARRAFVLSLVGPGAPVVTLAQSADKGRAARLVPQSLSLQAGAPRLADGWA
jgi:hypothetical protein